MKVLILTALVVLMLFGNEVLSWASLVVLACIGICKLLKAAAEGGFFD